MYQDIAKLMLYRTPEDSILSQLSMICRAFYTTDYQESVLIERIYTQINALLDLSTQYGFNTNLWQNYVTFLILTNENAFSLVSERQHIQQGSIHTFAKHDFKIFKKLFHYDFKSIEKALNIDCFTIITNYTAITKKEQQYNKNMSTMVQMISKQIAQANDIEMIFSIITAYYEQYGVGMFGLHKAFHIQNDATQMIAFLPITNMDHVVLSDLVGYQMQKDMLVQNTKAFVEGHRANNVLLYGDSGTGKSTSIKAIANEFYKDGLRMIEIYKHQFKDLSNILAQIKQRNYRFVIYMDDLSFEEFEIEYKFLKAVIEGGVETKPDNVLIYATSNRHHLIRETWGDRSDMRDEELHHSDTMQEKLSLVARFGLTICYERPRQDDYFDIVLKLAKRYPEITLSKEELCTEARRWGLNHGGNSGRSAQQLLNYLSYKAKHAV